MSEKSNESRLELIAHENFPHAFTDILQTFEKHVYGESTVKTPQQLYGHNVQPYEWIEMSGKPGINYRPFILTMDTGIKENAVSLQSMKQSQCSFVVFEKSWWRSTGKTASPVQSHAGRMLQIWPEVREKAEAARLARQQCKIIVPIKGKPWHFNF